MIIPARYGSTRFPGKPLVAVSGTSMIERVWKIASNAVGDSNVYIATDDQRIIEAAACFGAKAIMTSESCRNGSERVYDALQKIDQSVNVIVNLQGDAPITPPWFISALLNEFSVDDDCEYATPAVQISHEQYQDIIQSKIDNPFSGTFVTFDKNHNALYFSKQLIPALRQIPQGKLPLYKHIGLYAYRPSALQRYVEMEPTPLELVEGLEQLRLLESGFKIRIVPVDFRGRSSWAIDAPEDLKIVEDIIRREGEILAL